MLALYFSPGSSSMAPHIALHEVGATFEGHPTLLWKEENRTPDYLAINPEGKVPTLLVDGRAPTEVLAILFYLAKRFPEANLLFGGDEAEAQALSWMSFLASTVHPARRQGIDHVRAVLAMAEHRLGSREWALGRYSIADIHLFRIYWRLRNAFNLTPADHPGLAVHHDRMMARLAVQRTFEVEGAIGYGFPNYENPQAPSNSPGSNSR